MKLYELEGFNVYFPYEAYPLQLDFMTKVISALQKKENCLLESPTGTGKTLCLLCSTLSWLLTVKKELKHSKIPEKKIQIFYCSRTHSQLSQVIQELKNTIFCHDIKVSVLGSRDQMCLNTSVLSIPTLSTRNIICRQYVQQKKCTFHQNLQNKVFRNEIMDIEDFIQQGKTLNICPYYASRMNHLEADLVFLPFNYIIDQKTRQAQNIQLDNSIVIFDEAHNLESSCGEVCSFDIFEKDLQKALGEVSTCLQKVSQKNPQYTQLFPSHLEAIHKFISDFINEFQVLKLNDVQSGHFIYHLFEKFGIENRNASDYIKVMEECMQCMSQDSVMNKSTFGLKSLIDAMALIFMTSFQKNVDVFGGPKGPSFASSFKIFVQKDVKNGKCLSFWCFHSGWVMQDLVKNGVRSILLTSGTLSPLESFAADLQIPFQHQLENPHVIKENQLLVGILKQGPMGHRLNTSFQNRKSSDYPLDLGNALVNFSKIVPDGILVFFPSYSVMTECLEYWQKLNGAQKSIWNRLEQQKPFLLIEPKEKTEFNATIQKFKQASDQGKGSIFFAVCRGKASEGIDFSDGKARAVVLTGIPFPSTQDPKINLKKSFLNDQLKIGSIGLSGEAWYQQQAARAVNQALGRVIRHRHDWGVVLLCDERFLSPTQQGYLPKWVRPFVKCYSSGFGEVQQSLTKFFQQKREERVKHVIDKPIGDYLTSSSTIQMKTDKSSLRSYITFEQKPEKEPIFNSNAPFFESFNQNAKKEATKEENVLTSVSHDLRKIQQNLPLLPPEKRQKVETAAERDEKKKFNQLSGKAFTEKVKQTIHRQDYKKFLSLIQQLKNKEKKFDAFQQEMILLFDHPDYYLLLRPLNDFLPEKYQKEFTDNCLEIERKYLKLQEESIKESTCQTNEQKENDQPCPICKETIRHPFYLKSCKHLACFECFGKLIFEKKLICPVEECLKPFKKSHLQKQFF